MGRAFREDEHTFRGKPLRTLHPYVPDQAASTVTPDAKTPGELARDLMVRVDATIERNQGRNEIQDEDITYFFEHKERNIIVGLSKPILFDKDIYTHTKDYRIRISPDAPDKANFGSKHTLLSGLAHRQKEDFQFCDPVSTAGHIEQLLTKIDKILTQRVLVNPPPVS